MRIRIGFEIIVANWVPVPMLLALQPHTEFPGRLIGSDAVRTEPEVPLSGYVDVFGNRFSRVVAPPGRTTLWSDCIVVVDGAPDPVLPDARQHRIEDLPSETLQFLAASRYCESDELTPLAWELFGQTPEGWARVDAICTYVHRQTTFGYHHGRPTKTAHNVFHEKAGVCRDFAHLAVALCRAMNIPARYVSGYLGDIGVPRSGPGDFCAWFEVFLDGAWRTFDARYNVPRIGRIVMVRGRDAADVAMITSFGSYTLEGFCVWCDEVSEEPSEDELLAMLESRPQAEPRVFVSSGRV